MRKWKDVPQWRSIDSMPRDGTVVLVIDEKRSLSVDNKYLCVDYGNYIWLAVRRGDAEIKFVRSCMSGEMYKGSKGANPTHWHPLPPRPQIFEETEAVKKSYVQKRLERCEKKNLK